MASKRGTRRNVVLWTAAMVAGLAVLLSPSSASAPVRLQGGVQVSPSAYDVRGLDAHDGTVVQVGSTYYLYGTRYGCGFTWGIPSPWCGFGVWQSPDLISWTSDGLLFDPGSTNTWLNESWQVTCGYHGYGCFDPRMIQRQSDGVWMLWFNAPGDLPRSGSNAYYVMGCNGPAGPCGASAGPPSGTTHKPDLHICSQDGDATFFGDGTGHEWMACTMSDLSVSVEELDASWANGIDAGATHLAGLRHVESLGVWHDANGYLMTYSDPNCGYCAGTGLGYAWSTTPTGPWHVQTNVGASAPANGRRDVSSSSCGGQASTIAVLDGAPWQVIDTWTGSSNETAAGLHLERLHPHGPYMGTAAGGRTLYSPNLDRLSC